MPDKIQVELTPESEDMVALKSCQKTLGGLHVSAQCCADPKCVRKALKKKVNQDNEKRRTEINRKFCRQYEYPEELCNDPEQARHAVLDYRKQQADMKAVAEVVAREKAASEARIREEEEARKKAADEASAADSRRRIYGPLEVVDTRPPPVIVTKRSNYLELGFGLGWITDGAVLGDVQLNYSPPILGDRLLIGIAGGGAVIYHDRLTLGNFSPLFRAEAKGKILFNFVNALDREFQMGIGPSFTRIGRWEMDKLTASMPGATLRLKFGAFVAEGEWAHNLGPKDGYLSPGSSFIVRIGFNAADVALSR